VFVVFLASRLRLVIKLAEFTLSRRFTMKTLTLFLLVLVAFAAVLAPADARAQSIFLEPNSGPGIHLEALRPNISGINFTNLSYSYYLSGRFRAGETLRIRVEVPYVFYKAEYGFYDEYGYYVEGTSDGRSSLGNPYLGVEVGSELEGFRGEFGFRLPVVEREDEAWDMGMAADIVERLEAHLPDYLPVYAGGNYKYRSGNGLGLLIRLVPVLLFYNGEGSGDTEVQIIHSAQVWYEDEKVGVGAGFSGRYDGSGEADDFGERTLYQFGFFGNYRFGNFMPGFQVRFPLDSDLKDGWINTSYSFSLGVAL
jgi:hypothetical protein